jgi:hypothetical protein
MEIQLTPAEDLSLQHVLENGLAVLRSQKLEPKRRARTVESLSKIFLEAESGSHALHAQNLLFGVEQRPALERFTLIFNYLDQYFGSSLGDRLQEASDVFAKLKRHRKPDDTSRSRTEELIERLLTAFAEERSLAPLEPPRFFDNLS